MHLSERVIFYGFHRNCSALSGALNTIKHISLFPVPVHMMKIYTRPVFLIWPLCMILCLSISDWPSVCFKYYLFCLFLELQGIILKK